MPSLGIWMNGELVGEWITTRGGTSIVRYAQTWTESANARALSLSLPLTADREIRGPVVDHYFDNLLPDNPNIRRRIRERFGLRSTDAFDLLEAVGRDCVGAVQLLPPNDSPVHWNRIDVKPLSTKEVEKVLLDVAAPPPLGHRSDAPDDFRISIAGAQEKTALLRMGARWYRPQSATPTTHILKLPLGIIGNFRGDFSDSVENEWLCSRILRQLNLPVANTQMATFGSQRALVVERFDRRWIGTSEAAVLARGFVPAQDVWIARLPQEDFCQATGRSPIQRYESDGGPSMGEILDILGNSASAEEDRANFVLAQLVFWLLAATDGHGKNFSIHLLPGGAFAMTPLYDVLSAWPVIGRGANQLPIQDAKLAMAVSGKNKHYKLVEIQPRYWDALAARVGGTDLQNRMQGLVESVPETLEKVGSQLPKGFPDFVISKISEGMRGQARTFLRVKLRA
jgi:serine/threonine-protein kinase HipA